MTTTLPRCCATCAHYRQGASPCTGWCGHPDRLPETDVRIFVRTRELACRTGWRFDLWERRGEGASGEAARVLGVQIWGPFPAGAALDDLPGDLLGRLVQAADAGEIGGLDLLRGLDELFDEDEEGTGPGRRWDD